MAGDEGLDGVEPLRWRIGVVVVGFDPLVRVGGGCGEADGGVEGGEWRCGGFERDGVDDETGDGVVDRLWWQGGVALGCWVIWLGTGCGAEVDLEGFGKEGSSNDAAADEAAIDVPNLASGSVRETCICPKEAVWAYRILKLQEGVCGKMYTFTVPVRGLLCDFWALIWGPARSVDGDLLEADVVPVHVR